jgi:hypothetical protein
VTSRVIVTGCRDWTDEFAVDRELDEVFDREDKFTLVHGACPTGADEIARVWALNLLDDVTVEAHPADWLKNGKAAGPIRNAEMAKAGADLCLAFWDGVSRGTLDMIIQAVKQGIPVKIISKMVRK